MYSEGTGLQNHMLKIDSGALKLWQALSVSQSSSGKARTLAVVLFFSAKSVAEAGATRHAKMPGWQAGTQRGRLGCRHCTPPYLSAATSMYRRRHVGVLARLGLCAQA